eukprot:7597920-Alexandrium_andersonii.AAC.1
MLPVCLSNSGMPWAMEPIPFAWEPADHPPDPRPTHLAGASDAGGADTGCGGGGLFAVLEAFR